LSCAVIASSGVNFLLKTKGAARPLLPFGRRWREAPDEGSAPIGACFVATLAPGPSHAGLPHAYISDGRASSFPFRGGRRAERSEAIEGWRRKARVVEALLISGISALRSDPAKVVQRTRLTARPLIGASRHLLPQDEKGITPDLASPNPISRKGRGEPCRASPRQPATGQDRGDHGRSLLQHRMIPKSQNREALGREPRVARHVARVLRVLRTVALDDDPALEADEIDDVGTERNLTTPFGLRQAPVAQHAPERALGVGRLPPHGASA